MRCIVKYRPGSSPSYVEKLREVFPSPDYVVVEDSFVVESLPVDEREERDYYKRLSALDAAVKINGERDAHVLVSSARAIYQFLKGSESE